MPNLIAYIPVLNRQYVEWLLRHRGSHLHLISQQLAESLLPRLKRNMIALDTKFVADLIVSQNLASRVTLLTERDAELRGLSFMAPQEDVIEVFASRYLQPYQHISYESIWGRWDMNAVLTNQPVIADVEVSVDEVDIQRMFALRQFANRSPDWWRQVAASAYCGHQLLAMAVNTHFPDEYEVMIYGDPAINREAGVNTKISLALHAEQGIVSRCAQMGIPTLGATLKVTTFPCADCARVIAASGFSEVVFEDGYSNLGAQETLKRAGVKLVRLNSAAQKHPAPA